jgi:UDP-N-acetylmuramate dehydrogenase
MKDPELGPLSDVFGRRLRFQVPLVRYTASRVGGPADVLLEVDSADELAQAAMILWKLEFPFVIIGGGSNVLVSDLGIREVVLINRARALRFDDASQPPKVWAESGANFGALARQAASHGLSGLEWAAGIPGTLGGAIVGNAGAHGGEVADNLLVAEILQQQTLMQDDVPQPQKWPAEKFDFTYRSSILKQRPSYTVVLSATMRLAYASKEEVQAKMAQFVEYRHRTQPPGASMGSMFKNPPGDYAGRLIEAVGLKGTCIGEAQISDKHANFFINQGKASASDIYALINLVQRSVFDKFGVRLDLEIGLVGDWSEVTR